jgi:hypothetical protein
VQPPQPKAAAASADASSSASAEAADDGVKTRSSRRIKRDLGRWTEGSELHRDYEKIIEKLMAHPNAWPFTQPVDPVALNIPDYLDVVKQPMDLGTVQKNLAEGEDCSPLLSSPLLRSALSRAMWCVHLCVRVSTQASSMDVDVCDGLCARQASTKTARRCLRT